MAGKQAKILSEAQVRAVLGSIQKEEAGRGHRYPHRDRVMFLLSVRAGLRACEMARLEWGMVTDAQGTVGDAIYLENRVSKMGLGREIPMGKQLRQALIDLQKSGEHPTQCRQSDPIVFSERGWMSAQTVSQWFSRLYGKLGLMGCSSHSGRRTFITLGARKVSNVGGSLRDIQQMAGHRKLMTTQVYIEGSSEAKRKLVDILG